MYTIIPLAGPDFFQPEYGIKPLSLIDNEPLLLKAFFSRSWNRKDDDGSKVIFVLRDEENAPLQEFRSFQKKYFPKSKTVTVSSLTQGALLSAVAGSSLIANFFEPVVVDLVDFIYETSLDPVQEFENDPTLQGILTWFPSDDPAYSYLEVVHDRVIKTVEKKVISNKASVGTYIFKDLATFLKAAHQSILHKDEVAFKNSLFVCPAFSFLDGAVLPVEVFKTHALSKAFKAK